MRIRGQRPKLGALQRWTRECDAASTVDGSEGDREVLSVLDAIMRTADYGETDVSPVHRHADWTPDAKPWATSIGLFQAAMESTLFGESSIGQAHNTPAKHRLDQSKAEDIRALFRVCSNTPGHERRPPNRHPAIVYASSPNAISLLPLSSRESSSSTGPFQCSPPLEPVTRHDVPHVPGAFLLTSVLSSSECSAIISAASALEFLPDQPITSSDAPASILAANVYWLADPPFLANLWSRLAHLLPETIAGKHVRGLNARFRVYRYVPGAIYRPHLDGAWPASGLDPTTGDYLYDSSPKDDPLWSRLTLCVSPLSFDAQ